MERSGAQWEGAKRRACRGRACGVLVARLLDPSRSKPYVLRTPYGWIRRFVSLSRHPRPMTRSTVGGSTFEQVLFVRVTYLPIPKSGRHKCP